MAQSTLATILTNVLKEKWEEGFLDFSLWVFGGEYGVQQSPLLTQFFNPQTKMINKAKGQKNVTGEAYYVPFRETVSTNNWGPLEQTITAANPFTKEDQPKVDVFTLPTDRNWAFRHTIYFKDPQLFNNPMAVAGGKEITREKLLDFWGFFKSFWTFIDYYIYRSSTTPLAYVDSYEGTVTIDSTTYYVLNLKADANSPYILSEPFQADMKVDIYNTSDVKTIDSKIVRPYSATQIMSTTDLSSVGTNWYIYKEDTKGQIYKGWGDYIAASGTILGQDIAKHYHYQPTILSDYGNITIGGGGGGTKSPWSPIIDLCNEYMGKNKRWPDQILISGKHHDYLSEDARTAGMLNLPLGFNQSGQRKLDGGVSEFAYQGVPIIPVFCMPQGKCYATSRYKRGTINTPNFEAAVWGDKAIMPHMDGGGNIYLADQTNFNLIAHWVTLFEFIIWPTEMGEVNGILYT